jgi:hypothetical protein
LASEFAKTGYVAPMNVLWTYHLIHDSTELADSIWENYVKNSNQIMFQKVREPHVVAFLVDIVTWI